MTHASSVRYKPTLVFALLTCLALFALAAGVIDCVDAVPSLDVAHSLLSEGTWTVPQAKFPGTFYGIDRFGEIRSLMGFTTPLLYSGWLTLGTLLGLSPEEKLGLVSFSNALVSTALFTVLFYYFSQLLAFPRRALFFAQGLVFFSLLLPYSKTCHREPLQALCLLLAYLPLLPESTHKVRAQHWISSLAACTGVLTKEALLIPLLPYVYLAVQSRRAPHLLFLATLVFLTLYNLNYYGVVLPGGFAPSVTSFSTSVWSTPFWSGFFEQWISPQFGFFALQPIFLVWLYCVSFLRKGRDRYDAMLALAVLLQAAFYSKWYTPIGKEALGPRFLVATLPLMLLMLRHVDMHRLLDARNRIPLVAAFAFSGLVLGPTLFVKIQAYWTYVDRGKISPPPAQAPVYRKMLLNKLRGRPEIYLGQDGTAVDLTDVESLQGFHLWWAHWARQRLRSGKPHNAAPGN